MTVYRLDPIPTTLNNPRWKLSRIRERVWVNAESPDEARQKVQESTTAFVKLARGTIPVNPWYNVDALATCVVDTSRTGVPQDQVVRADGRSVIES